jgi:hypothetical protein
MAARAICRKAAFMGVVFGMACNAGDGCALESFTHVAGFTGHSHMLAGEREFRQAMIKLNILFPAGVAVTILASITQLALMNILRLVTADAGHFEF